MAKGIINKHIDSIEGVVLSKKFDEDIEKQRGEILICNDPKNPTIYIMDTDGKPQKISGGGSGEGGAEYDDTAIWDAVNKNSAAIDSHLTAAKGEINALQATDTKIREEFAAADDVVRGEFAAADTALETKLQGNIDAKADKTTVDAIDEHVVAVEGEIDALQGEDTKIRKEFADADKAIMDVIADNETVIAESLTNLNDRVVANTDNIAETQKKIEGITVNGQPIIDNPILDTDDFLIGEDYTILNQPDDNIYPGDLLTTAISKLEVMLANTTLSVTAALNDLDSRLGTATYYDAEGNKHEATGLYKKVEDLEFFAHQLENRINLLEQK